MEWRRRGCKPGEFDSVLKSQVGLLLYRFLIDEERFDDYGGSWWSEEDGSFRVQQNSWLDVNYPYCAVPNPVLPTPIAF